MVDLSSLLAQVAVATGADRQLDGDIAEALGLIPPESVGDTNITRYLPTEHKYAWEEWSAPKLTESADEALATVERLLPGSQWSTVRWGPADGSVTVTIGDAPNVHVGYGPTLALAVIATLLTALIAKDVS